MQFLQTLAALITKQIWLLGSSALSQIMCRNEIVGNKNGYCLNSVSLKVTKVKSKWYKLNCYRAFEGIIVIQQLIHCSPGMDGNS